MQSEVEPWIVSKTMAKEILELTSRLFGRFIEDELFGRCEVAFDAVHPRCICCREYQFEIVLLTPIHNFGLAVRSHIVQDNV